MLDLVIRGGEVVDGSGAPRRRADVGVRDGRVVSIGTVDEAARRTIDAGGRIVAPGFIDVHTHYDAQVFWDPYLTPSLLHGVTAVVGGNCGFAIAPIVPSEGEYLMKLLARVEGMPLGTLEVGVPWGTWETLGEYFDRLDGNLAINTGFLVGHTTIRRLVMGEDAAQRVATAEEIERMRVMLRESIEAGGLGLSSSWGSGRDPYGDPIPSRLATEEELVALAEVCGEFEGTSIEFIPGRWNGLEAGGDLMGRMSAAANRIVNWNVLAPGNGSRESVAAELGMSDRARERGGAVVALAMPFNLLLRFSFLTGFTLDGLPDWGKPMALPFDEKLAMFRDPQARHQLEEWAAADSPVREHLANWGDRVIAETFSPETKRYEGRIVRDIAAEENKSPFDALCDIAVADDLRTIFTPVQEDESDEEWRYRLGVCRDDRTLIGGSDSGAHLDFLSNFNLQTCFLAEVVRRRGLMSLEEAISHFTEAPAALYGLRDRGRLAEGAWADIVIFDETTVASGPVHTREDLPGGAPRLYADAIGIDHVLVNGVEVVDHGELVDDARPGRVLRSGTDTFTPAGAPGAHD